MFEYNRLTQLRQKRPLVHCVSNIVSANDCANLALAVGASPMMAQAAEEMEEITASSSATVLNTGTPDRERFEICRRCGQAAAAYGSPVVLDPVGVGASNWRRKEVIELLTVIRPSIIRVNLSEAEALCQKSSLEQGVDSTVCADREKRRDLAAALAARYRTTVLLSGEEDLVHDGKRCFTVIGGSERTTKVTGTGCMLSVLCGAFAAVEPDEFKAAVLASAFWKLCAEQAAKAAEGRGIGTFHEELINAAELLDADLLAGRGNIFEIRG